MEVRNDTNIFIHSRDIVFCGGWYVCGILRGYEMTKKKEVAKITKSGPFRTWEMWAIIYPNRYGDKKDWPSDVYNTREEALFEIDHWGWKHKAYVRKISITELESPQEDKYKDDNGNV